jgi:hypothetical protein
MPGLSQRLAIQPEPGGARSPICAQSCFAGLNWAGSRASDQAIPKTITVGGPIFSVDDEQTAL